MVQNTLDNAVVIVGGGFGGLSTACELSRYKRRPPVLLFEPRSRFTFSPLLYELLSDEMQNWEVSPRYSSLLPKGGVALIDEYVEKIDTNTQTIRTNSDRIIHYSQLIICTGAEAQDYGVPGVKEHAFVFQTLEDVRLLRQRVRELRTNTNSQNSLVIVGAGFSGVEIACKLADLLDSTTQIYLVEQGHQILPYAKSFNREQAEIALKERAINIILQTKVEAITENNVNLKSSSNDESNFFSICHQGLIWTAGSMPSPPSIDPKVSFKDGKVLVDSYLRVQGLNNVFAIGDLACDKDMSWPSTAQVAMQQGKFLAKNLMAIRSASALCPFEFQDLGEMLSLGVGNASITGLGLTISGPLAFKIRRIAYLARFPGTSLRLRSAGAWLLDR